MESDIELEILSDDSIFEFVVPTSYPISEEESHDDDIQNLTSNNNPNKKHFYD